MLRPRMINCSKSFTEQGFARALWQDHPKKFVQLMGFRQDIKREWYYWRSS